MRNVDLYYICGFNTHSSHKIKLVLIISYLFAEVWECFCKKKKVSTRCFFVNRLQQNEYTQRCDRKLWGLCNLLRQLCHSCESLHLLRTAPLCLDINKD